MSIAAEKSTRSSVLGDSFILRLNLARKELENRWLMQLVKCMIRRLKLITCDFVIINSNYYMINYIINIIVIHTINYY